MKLATIFNTNLKVVLCASISLALVEVPFALNAHAGMITTSDAVSQMTRDQNRVKVVEFIQRKEVRSQFEKFGVNPLEASQRVASMSDFELQKVANQIDQAPAGADVIVISLTTVLLVIIILLLIGKL